MHYYQLTTYLQGLPSCITEEQYQKLDFTQKHRYSKRYFDEASQEGCDRGSRCMYGNCVSELNTDNEVVQ